MGAGQGSKSEKKGGEGTQQVRKAPDLKVLCLPLFMFYSYGSVCLRSLNITSSSYILKLLFAKDLILTTWIKNYKSQQHLISSVLPFLPDAKSCLALSPGPNEQRFLF